MDREARGPAPARSGLVDHPGAAIWIRLPQVSSKHRGGHRAHLGRLLGEAHAERARRSYSACDVVDGERGEGDAVGDQRLLERLRRRVLVGLEQELGAVRVLRRDDGQPAMLAQRDVVSSSRSRARRCRTRSALAWSSTSTLVRLILIVVLLGRRSSQRSAISLERRRVEVVELVPALRAVLTSPAASSTSRCCEMAWRDEPMPCLVAAGRRARRASGRPARSARRGSRAGWGRRGP